jgi:hypothetical protein
MAWKPTKPQTQTQPLTSQQQQARAATQREPELDDIERMIENIPEAQAIAEQTHKGVQRVEDMANAVEAVIKSDSKPHIPTSDEIVEMIGKLSPTQLAKARAQMGVAAGGGLKRLPGGGVEVTIRIDADTVGPLESWAEAAGKTLEEQIQEIASMSINSFVFQDFSQPAAPLPTTVGAQVSGAPSVPPPAK